jgi:hypothetical protein
MNSAWQWIHCKESTNLICRMMPLSVLSIIKQQKCLHNKLQTMTYVPEKNQLFLIQIMIILPFIVIDQNNLLTLGYQWWSKVSSPQLEERLDRMFFHLFLVFFFHVASVCFSCISWLLKLYSRIWAIGNC